MRLNLKMKEHLLYWMIPLLVLGFPALLFANDLQNIEVNALSNNKIVVELDFNKKAIQPQAFSTEKPARIVLDLPQVNNSLNNADSHIDLKVGFLERIDTVQANGRTRMVLNLTESVPFSTEVRGKKIILKLMRTSHKYNNNSITTKDSKQKAAKDYLIDTVDFRRSETGAGRLIIDLSKSNVDVDVKEEGKLIRVKFLGAKMPDRLARKLDVTDFGTPVKIVEFKDHKTYVEALLRTNGLFDNIAYQTDSRFTVEVSALSQAKRLAAKRKAFKYTGERLSLNFQDIEVRAVLQLIADFTGLNMVASDTVQGNVTLRLQNVPWDQALDIILKTKGLDKRRMGNVVLVAPREEIAEREKMALQADEQVRQLAPLRSEFIQINYAKAQDLAALLKDEDNSLLSVRGNVSVDQRTNTLLVQDTSSKISEVRDLIRRLDIPVRQVLIEARVVLANDDFEKALGVDFGIASRTRDKPDLGVSGTRGSAATIALGGSPEVTSVTDRLSVQLPNSFSDATAKSSLGLALARLPGETIIDLELSALESEGLGAIISSPRLITSNQSTAYIESGEEIPFNETTSSGAASISFKKAVLRLEVTPQITPDGKIMLDLTVNQDSKGEAVGANFAIDTNEIATRVLVDNGETIVLGGIYKQQKNEKVTRIPFLGKIPWLGRLFSSELREDKRTELMIFVTPKIIQEILEG